jgi:long-chain acyl-CoA synthetase
MQPRWPSFYNFLEDRASRFGPKVALSYFSGTWNFLTYAEVFALSKARAAMLIQSGHQPGDRVATISANNLGLPIHLFGSTLAGLVNVPLDPKLSASELLSILKHVQARTLVVSPEFESLAFSLQREAGIEKVLRLETPSPIFPLAFASRERAAAETTAIYYTSGTLGTPKGVMVPLSALLFELSTLTGLEENNEGDVIFSILPLNHLYGLTAGVLYSLACGAEYVFAHSLAPPEIAFCLNERKVTQLSVVPLLLNLMKRGILRKFSEQPPLRRGLISIFLFIGPYLPTSSRRRLFASVHEKLGGALRRSVSGAAPLDPHTQRFFRAIGAPIFEGYGLTETGPVVCVNTTRRWRKGSVGKALPGVEVMIEPESGEILVRGPNVMQGYFRAPELTQEVLSADGWFRTGDLGSIRGGYLTITGRKKSLLVLESGKKVQAEEVEQAIAASPHFADVCVVGQRSETGELVVAVVQATPEYLTAMGADADKAATAEVQLHCRKLAPYKRPVRVILLREPFPKTSSGKVKRQLVAESIQI